MVKIKLKVSKFNESKKYEYLDECPSYNEFIKKIQELKEAKNKILSELKGDDNEDCVMDEIMDKL